MSKQTEYDQDPYEDENKYNSENLIKDIQFHISEHNKNKKHTAKDLSDQLSELLLLQLNPFDISDDDYIFIQKEVKHLVENVEKENNKLFIVRWANNIVDFITGKKSKHDQILNSMKTLII